SGYPECKTTKPVTLGIGCPEPGCTGQLVERRSRRGRTFFGCSAYPNCKFVVGQRPIPEPCPKCGAPFTTERATRGRVVRRCARKECDFEREAETSVACATRCRRSCDTCRWRRTRRLTPPRP